MKRALVPLLTLLLLVSGAFLAPAQAAPKAGQAAKGRATTSTISWQGYQWVARSAPGAPGVVGQWSPSNVSVDSAGRLHLKVTRDKRGRYTQAELDSTRKGWGYGTYTWTVDSDVSRFAPEYVLGLFTYGADAAYGHREIDIEAAGWGVSPITWDYTTWADGHNPVLRTAAPGGSSTQQFTWQQGRITWTSRDSLGNVIATATATGADVPVPGDEAVAMNFWLCGCLSGWDKTPAAEVVLSGFRFTPAA